jgi:hypothetical protein
VEADRVNDVAQLPIAEFVDLKSAETYLGLARDAYECGDNMKFIAARKLLMVSLGVADSPPTRRQGR